jgi:flavin-dependent dehydrogenase
MSAAQFTQPGNTPRPNADDSVQPGFSQAPVNTEVFVVGGGPAGLAGAIAARQHGFAVTLADYSQAPIDKACGEGIMPEGVAALRSLGVEVPREQSFPFRGIRFVENGSAVQAAFAVSHGLGVRRTVLHQLLLERACELGVTMRWGAAVTSDSNGVRCDGERVKCDWLICADGQRSRMRGWAALGPVAIRGERIGIRQHFIVTPATDFVEVHWHARGQAYVTPVGPNEVCVALIGNQPGVRMGDLWDLFPALREHLGEAQTSDSARGSVSASLRVRRITRGNLSLIGDAAGSIDAITGEGLSLAFRQALLLGDALSRGNLALYEAAHRSLERAPRMMERVLLAAASRDWLRRRALVALAARPDVFTRLLAVHNGVLPLRSVGLRTLAAFILRLLQAGTVGRAHDSGGGPA